MTKQIEQLKKFITDNESGITPVLAKKIIKLFGGNEKFLADHNNHRQNKTKYDFDEFVNPADHITFYEKNRSAITDLLEYIAIRQEYPSIPTVSNGVDKIDLTLDQIQIGMSEEKSDNPSIGYKAVAEWAVRTLAEYLYVEWDCFCHRNGFYNQ